MAQGTADSDSPIQTPKFRYQAILRDTANHLLAGQSGTVTFELKGSTWGEAQSFTTNQNGLVSLELDYGQIDGIIGYNWIGDTLTAVFTVNGQTITLKTPVMAVPYALQAGDVKITTAPMITDYVQKAELEDVTRIYNALKANPQVHDAIRDSVVNYIKANYPIAKDIAYDYLSKVDSQTVRDAYDTARNLPEEVRAAFYDIVKDYIKNHRSMLIDVAEYYLSTATEAEAKDLYESFMNSSAAPKVVEYLYQYFEAYLNSKHLLCSSSNMTLCDLVNYATQNTVCPTLGTDITGVHNADGYTFVIPLNTTNSNVVMTNATATITLVPYTSECQEKTINAVYNQTENRFEASLPDQDTQGCVYTRFYGNVIIPGCSSLSISEKTINRPN